jgi:hypothetical protein
LYLGDLCFDKEKKQKKKKEKKKEKRERERFFLGRSLCGSASSIIGVIPNRAFAGGIRENVESRA